MKGKLRKHKNPLSPLPHRASLNVCHTSLYFFAKFSEQKQMLLDDVVETLIPAYFSSYGYSFPLTGKKMFSSFLSTEGYWWINNSFSCLQRLWVILNCCYMCHFSWLFFRWKENGSCFSRNCPKPANGKSNCLQNICSEGSRWWCLSSWSKGMPISYLVFTVNSV